MIARLSNFASRSYRHLNVLLIAVGILIILLWIVASYAGYAPSNTFAEFLFAIFAPIPFSAAIVNLLLSQYTRDEIRDLTVASVQPLIDEMLRPVRVTTTGSNILRYRWRCLLEAAPKIDDYVLQHISISRVYKEAPAFLDFYFALSTDENCLSHFDKSTSRMLSWEVAPPPNSSLMLDLCNDDHFFLSVIYIDSETIYDGASQLEQKPEEKLISVNGGRARHIRFRVPERFRKKNNIEIAFTFRVLKYCGTPWSQLNINSKIYSVAENVSFSILVAPGLGNVQITRRISADLSTHMSPRTTCIDDVFPSSALAAAEVNFPVCFPGTAIDFHLVRRI